jgi:phosphatidylglycerophosphate synthase
MKPKGVGDIYRELKSRYQGSEKCAFDSENYFYRWYRPLSFYPSAVLIRFGVSANVVTAWGAICLLASFAVLATGWLQAGAWLYLLAYLIDFLDGNIARYAGKSTYFGKMIDGLVDSLTFLLFIALGVGNSCGSGGLWDAGTEMTLSLSTAFIFLFRSYFYLRVSYILIQPRPQEAAEPPPRAAEEGTVAAVRERSTMLRQGKKLYFGIISGMPVLLVVSAVFDAVGIYIGVYFLVFALATIFEVAYGLRRVWLRDIP